MKPAFKHLPSMPPLATLVLACCGVVLACAAPPAAAQGVDRVERQDQDRLHRADIRASVSDFVRIEESDTRGRRSLSDEERLEMRRQIDEAIRKAYGRRHRDRD